MFLPTHEILIIRKDGSKESIMMADCSLKNEIKEEAKEWFKDNKITNYENFLAIRYVDFSKKTIYECSIPQLFY